MSNKEEYKYSLVSGTKLNSDTTFVGQNSENTFDKTVTPINRNFLYLAACVGNLSAFACGISIGWTSPEIPKLKQPQELGNPLTQPLTTHQESWIGSLLPVGATLGPLIAGALADRIGRKNTLLCGTLPFILAHVLASFASSVLEFYLVRFLCGLGVGVIFTVLPIYIGEISEDSVRDALSSFLQLFCVIGILFSYCLGPYTSIRIFNYICVVPPCAFLVFFYIFIPESPYYLVRRNKEEAQKALMKFRDQNQDEVQNELDKIKNSVDKSFANKASFMDFFKSKPLFRALTIALSITAAQPFTGIDCVLFYAEDIFKDAGSTIPPEISAIIIGIVQVIASGSTPLIVEKKGKIFLLVLSAIGMAISLGVLSVFFYVKDSGFDVSSIGWLPITCLIIFIIAFCVGFGPLPFAVVAEIFPDNIKSVASTTTAASCWFLNFLVTEYFGIVSQMIGPGGPFAIFSLICVTAAVLVYLYLPDTSGKSFQEIQDILGGKSTANKNDAQI